MYVHRHPSQEGGAFLFSQKKTPWRYRGLIRRIRLKQTKFQGDGDDIRPEQRIVREAVTSFSPVSAFSSSVHPSIHPVQIIIMLASRWACPSLFVQVKTYILTTSYAPQSSSSSLTKEYRRDEMAPRNRRSGLFQLIILWWWFGTFSKINIIIPNPDLIHLLVVVMLLSSSSSRFISGFPVFCELLHVLQLPYFIC